MAAAAGGDFNLQDPVQSFISTARGVALDPANFFRGIRRQGDFISPLVFALICAVVAAVLGAIIGFLFTLVAGTEGFGGAFIGMIASIVRSLISVAIGLFIGAAIWHLLVILIIKPSHAGYEATFRVAAYSTVVYLVSWIPILGWLLSLYAIYLGVIGVREVHNTTTGKAAMVVLIPIAVVGFLLAILFLIAGVVLFSVLNNQ
jgi:hypothetical protein